MMKIIEFVFVVFVVVLCVLCFMSGFNKGYESASQLYNSESFNPILYECLDGDWPYHQQHGICFYSEWDGQVNNISCHIERCE